MSQKSNAGKQLVLQTGMILNVLHVFVMARGFPFYNSCKVGNQKNNSNINIKDK